MTKATSRIPKQNNHPPSFVCPLSYQVMEEPVSDLCSHSFERSAIEAWLARGNTCCPISRKALSLDDLKPNDALAERIEKWSWEKENEDMVLKAVATASSSSRDGDDEFLNEDKDDDDTEKSEDDVEMGKPKRSSKVGTKMSRYQEVPSDMMLLPQERQALERIRSRNNIIRGQRKRKKCCYCSLASISLVVLISFVAVYMIKLRLDEDEETTEIQDSSYATP